MTKPALIAMLGGTFDPVHHGHLRMAVELRDQLCAQVHLVPCAEPVHRRRPLASAEERLRMLQLACADEPGLCVDERELRRAGPSYSVDTLLDLRREFGAQQPLALVMGADAFNGLPTWHRWLEIPQLAHIIVLHRPGWLISSQSTMRDFLTQHQTSDVQNLTRQPAGLVLPLELSRLEISSTQIRQCLAQQRSARFLLPDAVLQFIQQRRLYQASSAALGDAQVAALPLSETNPRCNDVPPHNRGGI